MVSSKGGKKMSSRRPKSAGWAAFDLQQKQKDGRDLPASDEPFPSLPTPVKSLKPTETFLKNNHTHVKPFSSVLLPSFDYAASIVDSKKNKPSEAGPSGGSPSSRISELNGVGPIFRRLKELYSWADDGLIEDIAATAGNDFDKASSFLKAMVSDESSEERNYTKIAESLTLVSNDKMLNGKRDVSLWKTTEPAKISAVGEVCGGNEEENRKNDLSFQGQKLFDDSMEIDVRLAQLTWVPVEPEWEEDDLYLSCRKDAIRVMRAAARHSKSATNSFLRGDHFAAQQFSMKAREEWAAAETLNMKAADEILCIRNEDNGMWRLDLHGLHAAEAVQALEKRLNMVESASFPKNFGTSGLTDSFRTKEEALRKSPPGSCNSLERSDEQRFSKLRPKMLEVITGVGNLSRGGAALPTAVKTFLFDNGYRFDEARPGVVTVRPKFHHS